MNGIDFLADTNFLIHTSIIASTAIVYKIPLITSDQDFEKIKEIDLIFIEK
jgi:predicted nucleic acid-binding protein